MEKPQTYRREDMLPIAKVCKLIPGKTGGPCSRQHVHDLISRGEISPAFRFGGRYNIHVPRLAVEEYLRRCLLDPSE